MRIATKLTILLLLAVSVVLAAFGFLRMQHERHRLVEEAQQDAMVLTNAVRLVVEHAIRDTRPEDIQELLTKIVRNPSPVDRVRIYNTCVSSGKAPRSKRWLMIFRACTRSSLDCLWKYRANPLKFWSSHHSARA